MRFFLFFSELWKLVLDSQNILVSAHLQINIAKWQDFEARTLLSKITPF